MVTYQRTADVVWPFYDFHFLADSGFTGSGTSTDGPVNSGSIRCLAVTVIAG